MQWYAPCTLKKKTEKKKIPWPPSTVNKENTVYLGKEVNTHLFSYLWWLVHHLWVLS
jgi:hypothetical protein